jgi:hypothetical protein
MKRPYGVIFAHSSGLGAAGSPPVVLGFLRLWPRFDDIKEVEHGDQLTAAFNADHLDHDQLALIRSTATAGHSMNFIYCTSVDLLPRQDIRRQRIARDRLCSIC